MNDQVRVIILACVALLSTTACSAEESLSIEESTEFLETAGLVPQISARSGDRTVMLKVFGLEGARAVTSADSWNGRLAVVILSPPALSRRGRFFRRGHTEIQLRYDLFYETALQLNQQVDQISSVRGVAVVYLAPPATFGSGGRYSDIYSSSGIEFLNSAIDALSEDLGATDVVLAGQSAAGMMVANLMAHRGDIACAIISSAPLDLEAHAEFNPAHTHYFGATEPANPVEVVDEIAIDPDRKIFIGYSSSDRIVGSAYQIEYASSLERIGHDVVLEEALAADSFGHDLVVWKLNKMFDCAQADGRANSAGSRD